MAITYVFLLSSLGLVITQAQDCSRPVPGPNMDLKGNDINLNTFPSGTTVSFACNVGYTPKGGSPSITCTNGNWSAVKLECERKNCGALTEVTNGQIEYQDGTEFGDKAVVTCNTGYIAVGGTSNVICLDSGWSGRLPDCEVVTCAPPPDIKNGDYYEIKDMYSYREVVMYSCKTGATLSGSRSRTCSEDGSFKPEAPTCDGVVECKEPRVANGRWMSGARPPYTEKSTVTLECNPGYIMRGTSTQTCENGSWAPGLPICERVVECEEPRVANGVLSVGARPSYTEKSTVTLQCNTGYVMKGSSTQICDKNGRWSPGLPVCERVVECEEPRVANGVLSGGAQPPYTEQSTVTLQCNTGYVMKGSSTQTCDKNGSWSPGLPICERVVQCEVPHVANGVLSGGAQPPYTEKSTVTLQCNTGYVMKGSSTQICDKNGRWSPGLPVCEGVEGPPGTTDPPGTKDPPEKDPHNNAVAWGIGIFVGIVVLAGVGIGVYYLLKKKKSKRNPHRSDGPL